MAEIHPQLLNDTVSVGRLELCHVLLMNERNYPWVILVPDRDGISEIFQLSETDQQQLMQESSRLAEVLYKLCRADKINIAALGNVVPQLHVHHIARFKTDPAWPGPVWGHRPVEPYAAQELEHFLQKLKTILFSSP